jgi:5-methylcytosine-specific restriction endonuclease McrA
MVAVANPYRHADYVRNRALVLAASPTCQWPGCLNPATTADHIIPLELGGTNAIENLRASCLPCNSKGGAKVVNDKREARRMGRHSRSW